MLRVRPKKNGDVAPPAAPLDPGTIDRDAPLRLKTAAEMAFPFGGMTASGLRKEANRGNLSIERVAGKDFTTLAAIDEMRERCRTTAKEPAYGSAQPRPITRPSGSSAKEPNKSALDAALLTMARLSASLPTTSRKSTGRRSKAI